MIEEIVKLGELKSVGGLETGAIPISLYQRVNYSE